MAKKSKKRRTGAAAVEPPRAEAKQAAPRTEERRKPLAPTSAGAMGAYLGMAFGFSLLGLGIIGGLRAERLPIPLIIALCMAGPLLVWLCWQVLRRSRVAWSFAVALSGTASLVCLFSSPKIRDALALPIALAVLPAVIAGVVAWLLASASADVSSRS